MIEEYDREQTAVEGVEAGIDGALGAVLGLPYTNGKRNAPESAPEDKSPFGRVSSIG